jgi:hypothetical protein
MVVGMTTTYAISAYNRQLLGFCCLMSLSKIFWRSVLLVEETEVSGEIHRSVASHWQTYYYFNYIVAVSFLWWWKQEKNGEVYSKNACQ